MAQPRADTPIKIILSASDLHRVVDRIAHQILEKTSGATDTVLLGIPTRGVPLAHRLATRIHAFEGIDVPVGSLDITLYRDDLRLHATRALGKTELPGGGIDGRRVILVDDVLFSGRTVRAALDALNDVGRCSSPCWSTAGTGSCRSAPTTWARTSRPRRAKASGSRSPRPTAWTRSS